MLHINTSHEPLPFNLKKFLTLCGICHLFVSLYTILGSMAYQYGPPYSYIARDGIPIEDYIICKGGLLDRNKSILPLLVTSLIILLNFLICIKISLTCPGQCKCGSDTGFLYLFRTKPNNYIYTALHLIESLCCIVCSVLVIFWFYTGYNNTQTIEYKPIDAYLEYGIIDANYTTQLPNLTTFQKFEISSLIDTIGIFNDTYKDLYLKMLYVCCGLFVFEIIISVLSGMLCFSALCIPSLWNININEDTLYIQANRTECIRNNFSTTFNKTCLSADCSDSGKKFAHNLTGETIPSLKRNSIIKEKRLSIIREEKNNKVINGDCNDTISRSINEKSDTYIRKDIDADAIDNQENPSTPMAIPYSENKDNILIKKKNFRHSTLNSSECEDVERDNELCRNISIIEEQ